MTTEHSGSDFDLDEYVDEYAESQEEQGNEIVAPTNADEDDQGLVPLDLSEALDKHHEIQRANNRAKDTIISHNSRLKKFLAWLRIHDVESTADIRRLHFREYRTQRSKNVKKITTKTHMNTISAFVRNLEEVQAVPEGMSEYVRAPSLAGEEGKRSDHLPVPRGDRILGHARKYWWGSMEHVLFELYWAAAIRLGGIHSLDADDFDASEPSIDLKHRPDTGTTLKNKYDGERTVSLTETTAEAIEDYLSNPERPDVVDEHGREPLLASQAGGRPSKSHLRNITYWMTLPCNSQEGCPYDDRDPNECEYRKNKNHSSKCPGSKAPHALRSGALTRQIKREVPPHLISERANVSVETLYEHYVELSEKERMQVRRKWFDDEYGVSGGKAEEMVFGEFIDDHIGE